MASQIMQTKRLLRRELLAQEGLSSKKIAILSGSTIGEIQNILELYLLQHGIRPEFWVGGFNRFFEDAVFGNKELSGFSPDLIYIHTSSINIQNLPSPSDSPESAAQKLSSVYGHFEQVWKKIKENFDCPVIQNNFEPLPYRLFGNSDAYRQNGRLYFIESLNQKLNAYAQENSGFHINDLSYLSACYGLLNWSDAKYWYLYKYALNPDAIPLLCRSVAGIAKSIFGKNKKALALDLDNTLWGGVIGDDGAENIEIGGETPAGMAYADFQRYLKEVSNLGVLLTVCSKNDPEIAKTGFNAPGSILAKDDFIEFVANWQDKASNLKQIAQNINILPESIVLVDDNPAERELVSQALPHVSAPELKDPADYIRALDGAGYFEVTVFSADDAQRKSYYQSDKKRAEEKLSYEDYTEYLLSLKMQCRLSGFENTSRISQLINKTNQFNLTTQRMTENEVKAADDSPEHIALCAQLSDKFGDNGIVSALIARAANGSAEISLWVMSCRVFERHLEYTVFDELVRQCTERGVIKITGRYIPTAKNGYVKSLYDSLGFTRLDENTWEYVIPPDYQNKNTVIGVFTT